MLDVGFRAIWVTMSPSNKLFLLFFCGVSVYTLWVSSRVVLGLREFKKERPSGDPSACLLRLNNLRKRLGNLRQLHLFTLYLLLLCIAINIPSAFNVLGTYKTTPLTLRPILYELTFLFYLYVPIFLAFVFLHSVQWFVSARLESYEH